jgi:hypothetical protein
VSTPGKELSKIVNSRGSISQAAPGYALAAFGFLLSIVAFHPGYMTEDSIAQLAQGRSWQFDDWHPPVMAALWGLIDRVIPGPLGMLLLHNALYWGAAALFWKMTKRKSIWTGLAILLIGFMPQILAQLGAIWKDVGLGASLFLASALLYTSLHTKSRAALLGTIPLLFYGYAIRHNAALAIFPVSLWSAFIACRNFPALAARSRKFRLLPVALGVLYFVLLTSAVIATTKILTKSHETYVVQTIWLHDLVAISKERNEALFPSYVIAGPSFNLNNVVANYDPAQSTAINPAAGITLTNKPDQISELRTIWWHAIINNKSAYLQHRLRVFEQLIGSRTDNVCYPYETNTAPNPFGYTHNNGVVRTILNDYFRFFRNSILFRGVVWLLMSSALIIFSLRRKLRGDLEIAFVLATSSMLYCAGYFWYAPACDFRFLWWTTIAALLALIFFVSSVMQARET